VSFDNLVILVFFLAQWRISVLWLRAARRRWSGARLRVAQAAVVLFDTALLFAYCRSWANLISRLGIGSSLALPVGAAALAYLLLATAAVAIHGLMQWASRRFDAATNPARRHLIHATGGALLAAPLAALGYGTLVERCNFRVREIDTPVEGLPHDLAGLRILQLSDIHLSAFLSEDELARVIDAATETRPHLAVITGDLISTYGDPLDACIRQLARVRADAGVFACMGNHERYAGVENYAAKAAGRVGIQFLRKQSQRLRFGNNFLNLTGVDYQPIHEKDRYLAGAERLVRPGDFNVLLSHNPDVFPVAARQGYHLMLSGHTHGGQVRVEILDQSISAARFLTPYVYGLYRSGGATAYVTRGIGTIGLPTRIGAPPEISVLRLRRA
jgi:predicted MPP superfamily phosphohydrolase